MQLCKDVIIIFTQIREALQNCNQSQISYNTHKLCKFTQIGATFQNLLLNLVQLLLYLCTMLFVFAKRVFVTIDNGSVHAHTSNALNMHVFNHKRVKLLDLGTFYHVRIKLTCKDKAVLEPRVSPAFWITYYCNHRNITFENTSSMRLHWPFFPKTWTKGHLTPRWPLTTCLLRSHVWLYPRIIVSNTSMYVDTVINFAKYHIHTHTTYRMSDHIVSYWTQFRRDKNPVHNRGGGVEERTRLPKLKFSTNFPIGLHVIFQLQIKKLKNT